MRRAGCTVWRCCWYRPACSVCYCRRPARGHPGRCAAGEWLKRISSADRVLGSPGEPGLRRHAVRAPAHGHRPRLSGRHARHRGRRRCVSSALGRRGAVRVSARRSRWTRHVRRGRLGRSRVPVWTLGGLRSCGQRDCSPGRGHRLRGKQRLLNGLSPTLRGSRCREGDESMSVPSAGISGSARCGGRSLLGDSSAVMRARRERRRG